jgi:prepilin-type N-terminal cleavage/methylation domain-containing protein
MTWVTGKSLRVCGCCESHFWKKEGGFSLLEMVVALFIISILLGMTITATRDLLKDEELKGVSRQFAFMAKTARQEAVLENRPYEISMETNRWVLRPVAKENSSDFKQEQERATAVPNLVYVFPKNIRLRVRLWGAEKWEKERKAVWHFSSTGLCAPHTLRVENGGAWIQTTFNPLTANPQEEEWNFP